MTAIPWNPTPRQKSPLSNIPAKTFCTQNDEASNHDRNINLTKKRRVLFAEKSAIHSNKKKKEKNVLSAPIRRSISRRVFSTIKLLNSRNNVL